jgi:rod shape-determining protein MreD
MALKSNLIKTGITATILGLLTDFTSGGILGVFGFSRTFIAFLIRGIISLIDLKQGSYVFLITTISLSISNLIVNLLMFIISNYPINIYFILLQPFLTGLLTLLILKIPYLKKQLDVY